MFWAKCNKIITDEQGKFINCDFSPCPAYAVFGFVARPIDTPNGEVSPCSYQTWWAEACKIEKGHICSSSFSLSFKVKLHPDDFENKCGSYKGCGYSYQECVQSNDEGECTKTELVYNDCYSIKVYRLSPCFQDYQQFKQYFFSACSMDTNLQVFSGNYMTWEALQCCWNYWDNEAKKRRLAWNLEAIFYGQSYNCTNNTSQCEEQVEYCEEEDGEIYCNSYCESYIEGCFQMYNCSWGDSVLKLLSKNWTEEEWDLKVGEGLTEANAKVKAKQEDQGSWQQQKTQSYTNFCFSVTVKGGGLCYAPYYGSCGEFQWDACQAVVFKPAKPDDIDFPKPPKGVKVKVKGQLFTVLWDSEIKPLASTDDKVDFYGVGLSDCYGMAWNTCPSEESLSVDLVLLDYIW